MLMENKMEQRKLYAYLNIDNPIVAWEVAIGRIESICHGNKFGVSIWFYNLVRGYLSSNRQEKLQNELALEKVRADNFSNQVPRLTGIYLFNTREMAETAIDRWGLNSSLKNNIAEIDFHGECYTEVDSEWITDFLGTPLEKNAAWMQSYWSGETRGENPLTEVLASGIGYIKDKRIQSMAIRKLYDMWATSSLMFNAAIAGFATGKMDQICRVKPAILREDDGSLSGSIFIDMNDFNNNQLEIASALKQMYDDGYEPPIVIPSNPDAACTLPDLRNMFFSTNDEVTKNLFDLIHAS
jgi:hypothetical protein